jgi:kynurenine formamidase
MLFDSCKFIDLTHLLTPNIPCWDASCGFTMETLMDYNQGYRTQKLTLNAGIGTHMDAPSHFIKGGLSIDDIPLEKLIIPACVLNVSEKANGKYLISAKDVEEYETQHGKIPENSFVIGYTGWSRFWPDSDPYRSADSKGNAQFPSFSAEAAQLLLERKIAGIGIDTLSPDCDLQFPVHKLILGQGKYIVENMANCHLLPAQGAFVILLPLNMDTTESPIRAVGVIPVNSK